MSAEEPGVERAPVRRWKLAKPIAGLVIGAGLCVLLFRDTDWAGVGVAVASAEPGGIAMMILVGVGSHLARAQRLASLVRAVRSARFGNLFAANQIGLLVNYTIPARVGEAVRAMLLSRLERIPLSQGLAIVALDRSCDIFATLVLVFIAWIAFPMDTSIAIPEGTFNNEAPILLSAEDVVSGALGLVVVLVVLVVVLSVLALLQANAARVRRAAGRAIAPLSKRLFDRVEAGLSRFAEGLRALETRRDVVASLGWSAVAWGANVLGMMFLLSAFSIDFSWVAPVLILSLIVLATSIPVSPGLVGQYHIAVVFGLLLTVPGIDPAKAKAISLVGHLAVLLQVGGMGAYCLLRQNLLPRVLEYTRSTTWDRS